MKKSYFEGLPWSRFMEFISAEAERFSILKELLDEARLEYQVLELAGNRHFVITPPVAADPLLQGAGRRPPAILVAHYDRAEGSPGANDNSAAVFLLLETAVKLNHGKIRNWIVIFTDKEELKSGESVMSQGSYSLALGLKDLKLENSMIFSFDACGTGDTLIISSTVEQLLKREGGGEKLQKTMMDLRRFALDAARDLRMQKVLLAPTPFSDDAGFFRAGLAAQTITVLPSKECSQLVAELRKNPEFADMLINAGQRQNNRAEKLANSIPDTWRSLNGPGDSHIRLTPEHFRTVIRFAEELCRR